MKMIKNILVIAIIFSAPLFINAQPVPPTGAGHGTTTDQPGGGAPVDGGFSILLAMGAIYGSVKLYRVNKITKTENLTE